MKKDYIKRTNTVFALIVFLGGFAANAQNIQLSIENAVITNDGSFDYYEADITIHTVDGQADFKLGSGQIYFNYNTAAFGSNVHDNGAFEVTADYDSGYFLGESVGEIVVTNFYDITTINDNTTSRVSWSFSQGVSSGAMTEIVSTTPKKMVRIKFKYVDVGQDPMVVFEDDENAVTGCRDQFYTACGPYDSATTDLDCTDTVDPQNVNVQFLDANFDSSGATLSDKDFELLSGLSVYPNPTQGMLYLNGDISNIRRIQLYDIAGQKIMDLQEELAMIDIRFLKASIYFLDIKTSAGSQVIRIVKY